MQDELSIDARVVRAARRYRRRRAAIPIAAQLALLVPGLTLTVMWPPFTHHSAVRTLGASGLTALGGAVGLVLYSERITWVLDRAPLAPARVRVAYYALALRRTIRDSALTGITRDLETIRVLYLIADAARRMAGSHGDTIPGWAANDLSTTALDDADHAHRHVLDGLGHILATIETARDVVLCVPTGDRPARPDPRESFILSAATLDRACRSALDLATLALIVPRT
ncbi:hypothetical protein [Frankia sp. KB5]|uniref:hypothetical protein n=1 Tax=Frankia sp. KB5 TaxID=683318 RepID=UPI001F538DE6|nr:hypothetical protein [Frankia sp. KB5]